MTFSHPKFLRLKITTFKLRKKIHSYDQKNHKLGYWCMFLTGFKEIKKNKYISESDILRKKNPLQSGLKGTTTA